MSSLPLLVVIAGLTRNLLSDRDTLSLRRSRMFLRDEAKGVYYSLQYL